MKETQGTARRERPRARNKEKLVSPVDSYSPTIPFFPAAERLLNIQSGGGGICCPPPLLPLPLPKRIRAAMNMISIVLEKAAVANWLPSVFRGKNAIDRPKNLFFFF